MEHLEPAQDRMHEKAQPAISAVIVGRDALQIAAFSLLVCVLTYLIVRELTGILCPLFVALFICYLVIPVHGWLVRLRVPSRTAYILILAVVVISMYALGSLVVRSAFDLGRELPSHVVKFRSEVNLRVRSIQDSLHHLLPSHTKTPGTSPAPTVAPTIDTRETGGTQTPAASGSAPASEVTAVTQSLDVTSPQQLVRYSRTALDAILSMFSWIAVIAIYLIFLIAEHAGLPNRLLYALGPSRAEEVLSVTRSINTAISGYIAMKTLLSAVIGVLTAIVLVIFGVKYALVWGLIAFLAYYIPYIGSLVAVMLPVAMCLVQFGSLSQTLLIGTVLFTIHQVIGWVVEPRLMGRGLDLSPLLVLLSLAFWGSVWGLPGMVISTPLAVAMKIVLENIPATKPLARLCSNGPPDS